MEEGAVVGNFLLGPRIGKGAQASVFLARHRFLDREVALKVLEPQPDPLLRERFLREAKATASLEHPGIVRVLDCGIDGDVPYIAMELLLGRTLKEQNASCADGGYSLGEVMSVIVQITNALALAHTRGIIHRDLKPSNIFILNDGNVKLLDFGVAKVTGSDLTQTGGFVGNVSYAPFEQWRNAAEVTPAADVYSVGAIMFEMIVGRLPPRSESSELPAGTSLLRRGVPESITNLLLSCLDENPDLRPQNAEELSQQLQSLSAGSDLPRQARPHSLGPGWLAGPAEGSRTITQYDQTWNPGKAPNLPRRTPLGQAQLRPHEQNPEVPEPLVKEEEASQRRPRSAARLLLPALALGAALAIILVKGHALFGSAPATASIVNVQPAREKEPEPRPAASTPPPLTVVAAPGFPEDAQKALREGVSKKVALHHGALDLPSQGDWFLFWSDRTMSKSEHLPAAFVAHMTDREQLKTIVRPAFAVDGSWLILTSGAALFRSDSFPEDVFSARAAHDSSPLRLFEMISDDAGGYLSGWPSVSLYADGHATVTNDDGHEIQDAVSRVSSDGGIVDVIVEPRGEWMIIGNRRVAMSKNLDPSLRMKVEELGARQATVCQAVVGNRGRWALVVQESKGATCPRSDG